jgi:MFS family permease
MLFLAACLLELVTANMTFAIISPFFPIYGPTIGLSISDVSIVFSAMPLATLVASPLAGPLATQIGRRE